MLFERIYTMCIGYLFLSHSPLIHIVADIPLDYLVSNMFVQ